MRHGRAKAARKTLKFFSLNGNIKPPYKVILDGNFIANAMKNKVPLFERIDKLLQNDKQSIKLIVCRSALDELNTLPGDIMKEARQFGLDECDIMEREFIPKYKNKTDDTATTQKQHSKKKREQLAKHEHHNNNTNNNSIEQMGEAAKDIISLITNGRDGDAIINDWTLLDEKNGGPNNNQGYFIATQDENLANLLRNMPNVPLFRLSRGVLLLESPSSASRKYCMKVERSKQFTGGGAMTEEERDIIHSAKRAERKKKRLELDETNKRFHDPNSSKKGRFTSAVEGGRKKRKAKEPNPLSCKKRKSGVGGGVKGGKDSKK